MEENFAQLRLDVVQTLAGRRYVPLDSSLNKYFFEATEFAERCLPVIYQDIASDIAVFDIKGRNDKVEVDTIGFWF